MPNTTIESIEEEYPLGLYPGTVNRAVALDNWPHRWREIRKYIKTLESDLEKTKDSLERWKAEIYKFDDLEEDLAASRREARALRDKLADSNYSDSPPPS